MTTTDAVVEDLEGFLGHRPTRVRGDSPLRIMSYKHKTSYDVSSRYIKHLGHCTCRSDAIGGESGGVRRICTFCLPDLV